jgi:manganese/zinc/iron transport system permease protein
MNYLLYLQVLLIACLTAVSCSIPGTFLILRGTSLMSDAIGHAILLGIVLSFFITNNIHSPVVFIAATIIGIATAGITECLIATKKLNHDAAVGLTFPLFFSIAIILINFYASSIHIDTDAALLGELAFTPFNKLILNGIDLGPQALWTMSCILVINLISVFLWYPHLKITTFDSDYACTVGYSPHVIHYGLMILTSITIVGAFDTAGAILVVAFMMRPPSIAYLISDNLFELLVTACLISIATTITGYLCAHAYNVSIAGAIATTNGFIFALIACYKAQR